MAIPKLKKREGGKEVRRAGRKEGGGGAPGGLGGQRELVTVHITHI